MADGGALAERVEDLAATEGPWSLPEGWCWANVSDLPMGGDGSVEPFKTPDAPFVLYSVPSFESGFPELVHGRDVESNKQFVATNALLIAKINPRINRVWRVKRHKDELGSVIASTEWIVVRPTDEVEPDYLRHFLSTERVRQYLAANVSGVGGSLMRVNSGTVGAIRFPLAPLAEQRRIVARLDALLAEIAEGEMALAEARKGIDTFRRALLKAAVTGELTEDWRATEPVSETGHDLLASIANDRVAKGEVTRRRRTPVTKPVDLSALPQLPETWAWANLNALIVSGPTNGYSPKKSADGLGTLALKLTATTKGVMDLSDRAIKALSETIPVGSCLFLKSGDLLFQRGNTIEYVGIAAIYDGPGNKYVYPDLMIRVRTVDPAISEWIWRVANSPFGRQYMSANATGTAGTMPKISGEILRNFPVPIPPPAELSEILRRISEALAGTTDTLAILEAEAADAARLKQSILKAAFEGRVVPQDPPDEPAIALLARLAANQSAVTRAKRGHARKPAS
jgi:type I restriction enzyme, S subunit